ncbi:MAG TPA: hypothetical protein PKD26_02095 [Pyrinomonadaceae bacterium]|mgnify:CR=1 FL=1|nr:hypothetical protein [Pyrinomonadaceae bacterium]
MNFIKFVLAVLGLIFGVMLFFWLFGLITSLLWYGVWLAVIGGIGYGAYRMFVKAEQKLVGPGSADYLDARDYDSSWDEYKQKYLNK